jgi:hypothetical protein
MDLPRQVSRNHREQADGDPMQHKHNLTPQQRRSPAMGSRATFARQLLAQTRPNRRNQFCVAAHIFVPVFSPSRSECYRFSTNGRQPDWPEYARICPKPEVRVMSDSVSSCTQAPAPSASTTASPPQPQDAAAAVPATPSAAKTPSTTVSISAAAHAALQEATETRSQTAREAQGHDLQAQRLLAKLEATKA